MRVLGKDMRARLLKAISGNGLFDWLRATDSVQMLLTKKGEQTPCAGLYVSDADEIRSPNLKKDGVSDARDA